MDSVRILHVHAPVAQLDRVSDSDSEGHAFESRRAYHTAALYSPRDGGSVLFCLIYQGEGIKTNIRSFQSVPDLMMKTIRAENCIPTAQNRENTKMMTYEPKTDPNTGVKYVELTENDGCKFIENLPDFKDEAEEKAYYAGLKKAGYVDLETAEKQKEQKEEK